MAVLAHEEQAILGSIRLASMSTDRTSLTAVVRVDLDGHRRVQEGFVGNHAMQFRKGPFGVGGIGLPLLLGNGFGPFAVLLAPPGPSLGSLADVGQVLQSDEAMWVLVYDASRNDMIGVLRSPVSLVR